MDEKQKIYEKAKFFFEEKIVVHITKIGGWFNNGLILRLNNSMLVLDDEKIGSTPIFLDDISDIRNREVKNE